VAQAGRLLSETGLAVGAYLQELGENAVHVTSEGTPVGYPASLATTIRLALRRLDQEDPAGGQLLRLCAFLAPEPIPTDLFSGASVETLPEPLATIAGATLALGTTVGHLSRYGLVRISANGIVLHRLVQAIIRDSEVPSRRAETRQVVEQLVAAAGPGDPIDPLQWPRWATLLPHIIAIEPAGTRNDELCKVACEAVFYLFTRDNVSAAVLVAEPLFEQWRNLRGQDDFYTMLVARHLANAYQNLGNYRQAHDLAKDVIVRARRILGDDHPSTLATANNLACHLRLLGRYEEAWALDRDTFSRRRAFGDDDPDTLRSASNLATDLRLLGNFEEAYRIDRDTLARRRRILGDDHLNTLASGNNLANDLRALGEFEKARNLDEETLARYRSVAGDNYADTLRSASNLANDLYALGEFEKARNLDEETLARYRSVLGDNHPDTLRSASNLTNDGVEPESRLEALRWREHQAGWSSEI
jgi:hypothetical protein